MYTLVVVDMQANFHAARIKKVQENCKRSIRKAIKNKAPIIFVEFKGCGPTLPCLTGLTKGYNKVYHCTKAEWDGSAHSLSIVKEKGLYSAKFKVCGVFTECCVEATVKGLATKKPKSRIELLSGACGGDTITGHKAGIKRMKELPNVRSWC